MGDASDVDSGATIYADRVVAYLDLLGFSELVSSGRASAALKALTDVRSIKRNVDKIRDANPEWIDVSMFSDSIALSIDLARGDPAIDSDLRAYMLVMFVRHFCLALIEGQILARGAIVRGALHHEDPVVFGPALISAYQNESKLAVYPRILVEAEVFEMAARAGAARDWNVRNNWFKTDKDGLLAMRMFVPMVPRSEGAGLAGKVFYPKFVAILEELRRNAQDAKAIQKLDWILADIRDDLDRFGELRVPLVTMPE